MEHKFNYVDNFGNEYEVILKNKRNCVEINLVSSKKPLYIWEAEEIICDFINSSRKSCYEYHFNKYDYHTSYNFVNEKIKNIELELEKLKFMRSIIGKEVIFKNPSEYNKED